MPTPIHLPFPVIGIGGSAGALAALLKFFSAVPANANMAFVVVLHLSPDHESNAAEILQRATGLPVRQVVAPTPLEAGHVYVIAPGEDLIAEDGKLQPAARESRHQPGVIDLFFRTLGDVHGQRAVAIVLSGTGSDGSVGLTRVKERGGITLAQALEDAEYPDMPRAAIATGMVDIVLAAAEIGSRLLSICNFARHIGIPDSEDPQACEVAAPESNEGQPNAALEEILSILRALTRHDFRHYKRATVLRRIARRMQINGIVDLASYRDYLRSHPEESGPLLQDMLISVTSFFRDSEAFQALETLVLPRLFEDTRPDKTVRVWVCGCATGEESYSLGILLAERLELLRDAVDVQIFASDINESALKVARAGIYPAAIAADVSRERLNRFFVKGEGDYYTISSSIRDQMLFAKHDFLTDPPFSRLDLICCRNTLIYLERSAQASAMELFHYALNPGGFLFLGSAESADAGEALFSPVDKAHRIYRATLNALRPGKTKAFSRFGSRRMPVVPFTGDRPASARPEQPVALVHQEALLRMMPASVLVDADYDVLHLSPDAGRYIAPVAGIPTHNLLNNLAPDVRLEMRAALFRAKEAGSSVEIAIPRELDDGASTLLTIHVHPVHTKPEEPIRWLVVFDEQANDTAPFGGAAIEDSSQRGFIDRLEQEIKELKGQLQDTLDRSASSTEELRASNEELQAINEELRSASEELETSKEELQSMNEELTTVNYELRAKIEESGRTNDDLLNLISSSDIATVFVDSGLRIKRFTPQAGKLFNLIATDIGRPLVDIRNRLNYEELAEDAGEVFRHLRVIERRITGSDNEHFVARILPYRAGGNRIEGAVLTFFNVTQLHLAEDRARVVQEQLRKAIALSDDFAVITTDMAGLVLTWNVGATQIFKYEAEEMIGESIARIFTPEDRASGVPEKEMQTALEVGRAEDERWHARKDGSTFYCSGVLTLLRGKDAIGYARIARDMTIGRQELDGLLQQEKRTRADATVATELKDKLLAVVSHELKQPLNLIQVNTELLTRIPETKDIPAAVRIAHIIQRAVKTQTKIVNDLLDLSRVRTGKLQMQLEAVDLSELLRSLSRAIDHDSAQSGITLEIQGAAEVICNCDRVRVEQIMWNLIGNAVKFTPRGGRIVLKLESEGDFAKLTVADTGAGIPRTFLPHVFDMFSQAATAYAGGGQSGLGIGLALVSELTEAHGGRVEAASEGPNRGSTFTVWLPLRSTHAPNEEISKPDTSLSRWRVLMVDDDIDALEAFGMLLQLEGAAVDTADGAKKALRLLQSNTYDLLMSDLSMAEMDGFELIRQVRRSKNATQLPAIALSGYGRENDVQRALKAGFNAHISKPVSMEQLKNALSKL